MDDNPRVFYKKNHESKEIDAVFTLLVDCSASMYNKMDETKRGIVLFHEVLKSATYSPFNHRVLGRCKRSKGRISAKLFSRCPFLFRFLLSKQWRENYAARTTGG